MTRDMLDALIDRGRASEIGTADAKLRELLVVVRGPVAFAAFVSGLAHRPDGTVPMFMTPTTTYEPKKPAEPWQRGDVLLRPDRHPVVDGLLSLVAPPRHLRVLPTLVRPRRYVRQSDIGSTALGVQGDRAVYGVIEEILARRESVAATISAYDDEGEFVESLTVTTILKPDSERRTAGDDRPAR